MEKSNLRSVKNLMINLQIFMEQAMTILKLSNEERKYCQNALALAVG